MLDRDILAIFIQGSRLYGHLDFANSIFFVSVLFGQRQKVTNMFSILALDHISETFAFCYVENVCVGISESEFCILCVGSLGVGSLTASKSPA